MSARPSYIAAAFNARPLGMPLAPNWFAVAAVALLGTFLNPAFWLIGAGLEGLYLWTLSRHPRFRAVVDAGAVEPSLWQARYDALLAHLDDAAQRAQDAVEKESADVTDILARAGAGAGQLADVRQMAWLHLRLLAARAAFLRVIADAGPARAQLDDQATRLRVRLEGEPEGELRRSLEQQVAVIEARRQAHAVAQQRRDLVDAELERLRQQISLVREQALLATDEGSVAPSLDAVAASLNEANKWLKSQRELFTGLDELLDDAPPAEVLQSRAQRARRSTMKESA
ncbi:MAG: hypothetical protein ABI629_13015 [bacterium]